MNKLDMEAKDMIASSEEILRELFPNCFIEGKLDVSKLKLELSSQLLDDTKEKYELTWPGKKQSIVECNKRTNNTLLPQKNKSIMFNETKS